MKSVYKIGRLYIVSDKLFECFDPFKIDNLQSDDAGEEFYDEQGVKVDKPASFHADKNVLFIDFKTGEPDLENSVKVSSETQMDVLKIGNDWVYASKFGKAWVQVTPDYTHATYYVNNDNIYISLIEQPVLMAVQCRLLMMGYIIIHSACIEVEGKAVLFSAPSGVGKSTRANRWIEAYGASFISGDRPIIDPISGTALGAPLDGKEQIHRNVEMPIAAFNCIKRAEKTKVTRITDEEKKKFLATQTFIPMWDPMLVAKVFAGIKQMIARVTIWNLECDQTIEAARECHDIIFPKEPENVIELLAQLKASDMPKDKYIFEIDRFMDFKARKLGIPHSGTFELTPFCNLDCKMCYVHLNKDQMAGSKIMSLDTLKDIVKDAKSAGMRYATLTGGECLTYPDFDDFYLYLQELGIGITVLTNGLLLNEKRIEFFKNHPVRRIQLTLYGSNDDAYEKVTGVRCFDLVWNNILMARDANLPIIISITPNAYCFEDMANILSLVEKNNLKYNVNPKLITPRKSTGRDIYDMTTEQYIEIYRLRAKYKSDNYQEVNPSELPDPSTEGKSEIGIQCAAGRSTFALTWDGKMLPCQDFYDISDLFDSEGNFKERWGKINDWAKNLALPCECSSCPYRPSCIQCIAQHFNPKNPGHCNKSICQHSIDLAKAGVIRL